MTSGRSTGRAKRRLAAALLLSGDLAAAEPRRPRAQEAPRPAVEVFPDDIGSRRSLHLLRKGEGTAGGCPKWIRNYSLSGAALGARRTRLEVDASGLPGPSVPRAALAAARSAAHAWASASPGAPAFDVRMAAVGVAAAFVADGRNTVSWKDLSPFSKGTLAAVQLMIDPERGKVSEFDVALDRFAPWSAGPRPASGAYDLQGVLTHALGAALGLGTVEGPEDCALVMYHRAWPGETIQRRPGTGDLLGLTRIYP